MNHPKREDWAPYLFGEAKAEERTRLSGHLQSCPQCAAEIAGWQRSLRRLDRWKLPAARARSGRVLSSRNVEPRGATESAHSADNTSESGHCARSRHRAELALKWGLAAALVLGAGFALGRLSTAPAAGLKTMRAEMEASVRASLASELRREFDADAQTALAASRRGITNQFHMQLNAALAGVVDATAMQTRRQLDEFVQAFNNAHEEDRRTLFALIEKVQKQHDADYLSLRTDLETVASLTDEEIRRARQSLLQLAANKSINQP